MTRQDTPTTISHESVRRAFKDLVMADELLDALGPAIRSDGAIFLYGPPGTGKSAIAERLIRVHQDAVLVPHTVEVDGQIITVFDPVMHQPIDPQPARLDRRWVLCRRPSVIVGGELTATQLNLSYDSHAGIYLAPLQMQANNGILVIDDFGRQVLTPEQLLNRWIVPLDRRIDYLTLDYGVKFETPCAIKIVFSTNLEPTSLADEAFFRRIRSKVLVPPISDEAFDEILARVARATSVTVTADAPEHLRLASRQRGDGDLRPYLPGAVCELVRSISAYDETAPVLDAPMIDRIVQLYFTQDPGMRGAATRPYEPPNWRTPSPDDSTAGTNAAATNATGTPAAGPVAPRPKADDSSARRALLEATHRLIWATGPDDIATVTEQLAAALHPPRTDAAGDDDVVSVPTAGDLVLRVRAPAEPGDRRDLERDLLRWVADARRTFELTAGIPTIEPSAAIDPETGLASRRALTTVLARLAADDTVLAVTLDEPTLDGTEPQDRTRLLTAFAHALTAETRGHDHLGRYGPNLFVVVLTADAEHAVVAPEAFLRRLLRRWALERPSAVGFRAGTASARRDPGSALLAAEHAAARADVAAETPWLAAVGADYE